MLEIAAYVLPEGEMFRYKEKKVTLVVKYAPEEDDLFNSSDLPLRAAAAVARAQNISMGQY